MKILVYLRVYVGFRSPQSLYLHLCILCLAFLSFILRQRPELHAREVDKMVCGYTVLIVSQEILSIRTINCCPFGSALLSTAI